MCPAAAQGSASSSDQGATWYAAYQRDSRSVRLPGGRQLNLYCLGSGSPTVVLEPGIGESAFTWWTVQASIAKSTRVCAYDRAGMGRSAPGPLPRDTVSEVNDVVALLSAARVRPPYILVGHSMGGFNARLFASLHPDDVKGMVLIDPSIENQIAILEAAAPAIAANDQRSVEFLRSCADPHLADSDFQSRCARTAPKTFPPALATAYAATQSRAHYVAFAAEVDAFFNVDSQQVLDRRRSFGAMPLIVLTRGERSSDLPPDQAEFEWTFLHQKHGELAALSSLGVHRVVPGASHYIHQDKPDVVVDAAREVLRSSQGGSAAKRPRVEAR